MESRLEMLTSRGVLNLGINNRTLQNEKNVFNERPFCIFSEAKALGCNIKVDLEYVGRNRNRNFDVEQNELPKIQKLEKLKEDEAIHQ